MAKKEGVPTRAKSKEAPKHILSGHQYKCGNVLFEVVDGETYSAKKVSPQYKDILAFPAGTLVAIEYRGTLIPNIVGSNGVVRLTSVNVGGKIYSAPGAISKALGIDTAMAKYSLTELVEKK